MPLAGGVGGAAVRLSVAVRHWHATALRRMSRTVLGAPRERIYAVVRCIPRGRVATYGQVATLAALPGHARLVGYALAALSSTTTIPWHRVINAEGRVSTRRTDPGGAITQRIRLETEGVRFDARGRVPLDRYAWPPRPRGRQHPDSHR